MVFIELFRFILKLILNYSVKFEKKTLSWILLMIYMYHTSVLY